MQTEKSKALKMLEEKKNSWTVLLLFYINYKLAPVLRIACVLLSELMGENENKNNYSGAASIKQISLQEEHRVKLWDTMWSWQ